MNPTTNRVRLGTAWRPRRPGPRRAWAPPVALVLARRPGRAGWLVDRTSVTERTFTVRSLVRPIRTVTSGPRPASTPFRPEPRPPVVRPVTAAAMRREPTVLALPASPAERGRGPAPVQQICRLQLTRLESTNRPAPAAPAGPSGPAGAPGPRPFIVVRRAIAPAPPSPAAERAATVATATVATAAAAGPAGPPGQPAPDLEEITTAVLRRIERRAVAQRERMGHG